MWTSKKKTLYIYNDVVLPARVESTYYKSKKKWKTLRGGVKTPAPSILAPVNLCFHRGCLTSSHSFGGFEAEKWLALPVGNEGPSTFTAWYIGDAFFPHSLLRASQMNSSFLKINGWKMKFPFSKARPIFRVHVSFRVWGIPTSCPLRPVTCIASSRVGQMTSSSCLVLGGIQNTRSCQKIQV